MKIEPFHLKNRYLTQAIADLRELLAQPTDKQKRPCLGCVVTCNCEQHSRACCCGCSETCPYAGAQLSSDPSFIVESKVLPLVYALNQLQVIQTCWSCEGHNQPNGMAWKIPEVWFYSGSAWYANLISEHLNAQFLRKKTAYHWVVSICPNFHPGEVSYSIKPDLNHGEVAELAALQRDVATFSKDMYHAVIRNTRDTLAQLEQMVV